MPGVQVHDDGGGVADQAAGSDFQQLGVPLELQGEGLQGDQAEFSAQRSPSRPQSRGRGWLDERNEDWFHILRCISET